MLVDYFEVECFAGLIEGNKRRTTRYFVGLSDGETDEWLGSVEKYPKEWVVASMENGDRYFDLRIMPALYLVDKDKKIILRNTSLEEVEKILKENK